MTYNYKENYENSHFQQFIDKTIFESQTGKSSTPEFLSHTGWKYVLLNLEPIISIKNHSVAIFVRRWHMIVFNKNLF